MQITILCSSVDHPINNWLSRWMAKNEKIHQIELIRKKVDLTGGDLLFLISCSEIISKIDRQLFKKALVIHASDLPQGRGWSPHIWQIIEGRQQLFVTLLEAEDEVDSGNIWRQEKVNIPNDALYDEINHALFDAELKLMDFAVFNIETVNPRPQGGDIKPTYYPRRCPTDSEIDATQSIEKQFNLIRVCDPIRFPAFFRLHGKKYKVVLEKMNDE